jgi:AcrR family transcriptional regulator
MCHAALGYEYKEPEFRFRFTHVTKARLRLSTPVPTPRPGPGAKPLRADAARNRQKILDAARAAFAEDGRDAQIDDVARRAGVGVGTVYRHFPTKESLALAIVEQRFATIIEHLRNELIPDPDPWHALERSFELCVTTQLADRGYADAVASLADANALAGPMGPRAEQMQELMELSGVLVDRARAAGVVRDDLRATDMPPLYAGLASVVQAGVADWRRYVEILLDGLRPR